MSFRKQEPIIEQLPITDQEAKEFEKQMYGQSFEEYCYAMGFLVKNSKYPMGAVNYATVKEYTEAKRKWNALQNLRMRRFKAEQYDHQSKIAMFNNSECPDLEACKYCHPKSLKDTIDELKEKFDGGKEITTID